ncbi:MAG: hypothetical protein WCX22_04830 [Methanoregula sp.]
MSEQFLIPRELPEASDEYAAPDAMGTTSRETLVSQPGGLPETSGPGTGIVCRSPGRAGTNAEGRERNRQRGQDPETREMQRASSVPG